VPVRVPARAPHAALLDEAAPEAEPVPEPVRARPGERRLARAAAQRGVLALGAAAAARAHGRARARARDIPLGAVLARSSFALALAPAGAEAELAEDAARAVLGRIVALLDDVLEELVLAVVVLLVAEAELALEGVGALAARAELDALVPPDAQRARALVGRDEDARRRRRCGGGGGRARRRRRRGAGRPRRRRKDDALFLAGRADGEVESCASRGTSRSATGRSGSSGPASVYHAACWPDPGRGGSARSRRTPPARSPTTAPPSAQARRTRKGRGMGMQPPEATG